MKAICKVLSSEIQWPDEEERKELCQDLNGILHGVVGILDVTEHPIERSSDNVKEAATFSGKAQCNTMKTLAVIDR